MGVVHLARREADGQLVALKVIRPAVAAERGRARSVPPRGEHPPQARPPQHRPVPRHRLRRRPALLRDGVRRGDERRRRPEGPRPALDPGRLSAWPARSSTALSYAHALGFVHRDIKPANILMTKQGGKARAKLADFGLAKIYQESSLSGLSLTGQMGGTLDYMPPEQITHFREAKPPADLYAVGATLYTLLTGRRIFDFKGRPEQQVLQILLRRPHPDPGPPPRNPRRPRRDHPQGPGQGPRRPLPRRRGHEGRPGAVRQGDLKDSARWPSIPTVLRRGRGDEDLPGPGPAIFVERGVVGLGVVEPLADLGRRQEGEGPAPGPRPIGPLMLAASREMIESQAMPRDVEDPHLGDLQECPGPEPWSPGWRPRPRWPGRADGLPSPARSSGYSKPRPPRSPYPRPRTARSRWSRPGSCA